jgi:hypothetical protein
VMTTKEKELLTKVQQRLQDAWESCNAEHPDTVYQLLVEVGNAAGALEVLTNPNAILTFDDIASIYGESGQDKSK